MADQAYKRQTHLHWQLDPHLEGDLLATGASSSHVQTCQAQISRQMAVSGCMKELMIQEVAYSQAT